MLPDKKQQLLAELLAPPGAAQRQTTLAAAAPLLRRRRRQRFIRHCSAALAALCTLGAAVHWFILPSPVFLASRDPQRSNHAGATTLSTAASVATTPVPTITDAELLEMFGDVPVGLITLANGEKRLLFPRPEDQERFVSGL